MINSIEEKEKKLKEILSQYKSVAIAFSGGTDSTLLLYYLAKLNIETTAFTYNSCAFPEKEIELAKKTASDFGIKHIIINIDPFKEINGIENNPPERCYICKKYMLSHIKKYAEQINADVIIEGSNFDDINDYRPGRKAVKEYGLISPLEEAQITKQDVRLLLKKANLIQADKKSFACYFSRFPYNNPVNEENMRNTGLCEEYIHSLGLSSVRLRNHNNIARIEADIEDMEKCIINKEIKNKIISFLKNHGFSFVTLDMEGYKTGSMNKLLDK